MEVLWVGTEKFDDFKVQIFLIFSSFVLLLSGHIRTLKAAPELISNRFDHARCSPRSACAGQGSPARTERSRTHRVTRESEVKCPPDRDRDRDRFSDFTLTLREIHAVRDGGRVTAPQPGPAGSGPR